MKIIQTVLFCCLAGLIPTGSVLAIEISYELIPLGGSNFRYQYAVANDGSLGGVPVEGFSIFFDPAEYLESSLSIVTPDPPSSEWSELILGSAVGLPAFYDSLAMAGGVPAGTTVSGFAVAFQWLGIGIPGAQMFEIYDPATFPVLESGTTVAKVAIPEPWSLSLFAISLGGMVVATRKRRLTEA